MPEKAREAFRTISEVANWLDIPAHVLRFWESKFPQIKPVKRAGGRRYYRPTDMELIGGIKKLLHDDGLTIRGVQKMIKEDGVKSIAALSPPVRNLSEEEGNARRSARRARRAARMEERSTSSPVDEPAQDASFKAAAEASVDAKKKATADETDADAPAASPDRTPIEVEDSKSEVPEQDATDASEIEDEEVATIDHETANSRRAQRHTAIEAEAKSLEEEAGPQRSFALQDTDNKDDYGSDDSDDGDDKHETGAELADEPSGISKPDETAAAASAGPDDRRQAALAAPPPGSKDMQIDISTKNRLDTEHALYGFGLLTVLNDTRGKAGLDKVYERLRHLRERLANDNDAS